MSDNKNTQGVDPLNGAFWQNFNRIVIIRKKLQKVFTCVAARRWRPNPLHLQAYEEPFQRNEQMDESNDRCASVPRYVQTILRYELQ
jgi:hypothetical protein